MTAVEAHRARVAAIERRFANRHRLRTLHKKPTAYWTRWPLRTIVSRETGYDVLTCGHHAPVQTGAVLERRRCRVCAKGDKP